MLSYWLQNKNSAIDKKACNTNTLSILTAIFHVNLGYPVFIEANDDGGVGDNYTTAAISRTKL